MNEIEILGLDMKVYTEKLKNDLEVYYIPYSNKNNYLITYATRFGSESVEFCEEGSRKNIKVPYGIAHFLEHKMFEQSDGEDPFKYYAKTGTGVNASTSYTNTKYICYGTKAFEDNLSYLLNFVNSPYYTDENVEKEKGIIAEEIKMYADIPDWMLDTKLRENIYKVLPRRIDIAGGVEDIKKITKEELYLCYKNFYVPNNMFIVISGNFDRFEASRIIHERLDNVHVKKLPIIKKYKEDKKVNKEYEEFYDDINVSKIAIGLKTYRPDFKIEDDLELDLYLEMFSSLLFGSSSMFREYARENKLISSFGTEWESTDKFRTLIISSNSKNPDLLIEKIKNELNNSNILEEDFDRMKKVWIAGEVKLVDYVDIFSDNLYDDILKYHKIYPEKQEMIRNLDYKKLLDIIKQIDFSNLAIVKMMPKNKEA